MDRDGGPHGPCAAAPPRWSLGWPAPAAAEEPLSVDLRPAAAHRRGRPGLPRDHLPERAGHDDRAALPARVRRRCRRRARHALRRRLGQRGALRPLRRQGCAEPPAVPTTSGDEPAASHAGAPTRPPAALGGDVLADTTVGESAAADDGWQTLASVLPGEGDHVDGRYVFRLEVTAVAGNDGNIFTATLSIRDRRDAPPAGLEIVDYAPTVRVLDRPPRHRGRARHPGRRRSDRGPQLRRGGRPADVREHVAVGAARRLGPGRVAREHGRAAPRGARHDGLDPGRGRPGAAQRPHPVRHR